MIQELNPYITVTPVSNYKQRQNVTIVINKNKEETKQINNYTRSNDSKMVSLWSYGLAGVFFTDANTNHTITDATGENIESVQIGSISTDGLVTCAPNSSHNFQSGDTIMFSNMEGTNLDIFNKEYMIKVINTTSFKLNEFVNNSFVFINGTANHIKKPITIDHESFENQLANPSIVLSGAFDMDHSMDLINMFLHDKACKKLESMTLYEFIPVVSIMGAFVASEAIKLVSNKYMPATQWFTWSDVTLIPKAEVSRDEDVKTDYGELWGSVLETKLMESNWLLVGSGAIGCEHLKNMAFMGIRNVTVTDPDSIEKSNLNRQFLFRSGHIGKPKSITAVEVIKKMKHTNYKATLEKVGSENVSFTNNMLTQVDGVINALDNIKARRFMDEQCFKFNLPLFESGTTGTKGNTQTVVPFLTETYSASNDPDTEKSFPLCTIKSFPNEIVHTIHWAMDWFEFFNRAPATMNRWIMDPGYLESLSQVEKNQAIEDINALSTLRTSEDRLNWAIDSFVTNYRNNILQLLSTFPADHEVTPGVRFWSGGKRCPKAIVLDHNNTECINYIIAVYRLISNVCGMKDDMSDSMIKEFVSSYKMTDFTPKVANEKNEVSMSTLNAKPEDYKSNYVPQDFEKDDDTNHHIEWVTAASNMRALNYGIIPVSHQETKGIAGRIIPAIATTTAAVSGLVMLEMLKYLLNIKDVTSYRSNFINLASPHLVYSDPMPAKMIDVAGVKVNEWTKFEYKKDRTLGEFKSYYEEVFKTTISMIVCGTAMVYAEFLGEENLNKKLSDIIKEVTDNSNVTFSLASEQEDLTIPDINIIL
jgi:ubiquitin-activating enzyme E1